MKPSTSPEPSSDDALPGGVEQQYFARLQAGRFDIQQCADCRRHVFHPREICPHCGGSRLDWVAPSGRGTVYSTTTVARKPEAGGDYNVCLVDLAEGVRMMATVDGLAPDAVAIGLAVQARVVRRDGAGNGRLRGGARMSAHDLRGKTAIAGIGQFGLGQSPGFSDMELLVRASALAVADAGLTMRDIDGVVSSSGAASMWVMSVVEHLGLRPTYIDGTCLGGSSFISCILAAARALESGQCHAVLVCYGSAQRTATMGRSAIAEARKLLDPQPYEAPYKPLSPVSAYALAAQRHMHQYGTRREHLAEVAVAARRWAQLNPEAFERGPLTIDDVLSARKVSSPFTVRDCCLVTDGAGAYVMVRADRARDLAQPPIHLLGSAAAVWNRQVSEMDDLTVTAARQSGESAFAMAGCRPSDIDVVGLYDAFTINPILFLEDLGFCAKGEGGDFVADGGIAPGGRLPVNTNGGGLSCVHPGMYGVFLVIEAVRQLRGVAGARQVPEARLALVNGNGGTLSSQATAIFGTAETV